MRANRLIVPLMLLAVLSLGSGCTIFNPGTNPDGTPKVKPLTLTQRTTQYTEIFVGVEKSINDLFDAKVIDKAKLQLLAGPIHAARQGLSDMRTAARQNDATAWGVYEKGFLGILDGLIAERRAAEAKQAATTRPAFSPP